MHVYLQHRWITTMNQVEKEKNFSRECIKIVNRENGASRDRNRLLLLAQQYGYSNIRYMQIKKKIKKSSSHEKQQVKVRNYLSRIKIKKKIILL